jgi:hypothetical protein
MSSVSDGTPAVAGASRAGVMPTDRHGPQRSRLRPAGTSQDQGGSPWHRPLRGRTGPHRGHTGVMCGAAGCQRSREGSRSNRRQIQERGMQLAAARTIEPSAGPRRAIPASPKFFALPSLSYVAVPWRRNPCGLAYIGQQEVQMLFSMSEAAKAAGVAPYRIKYALQTKRLPEPGRVGGRRVFSPDDVELIRRHFKAAARGPAARPGHGGGNASSR